MEDWQELAQTVILGLMFSYLVAKLISTVVHFRENNLKVVREDDLLQDEEEEEDGEEEEEEEESEPSSDRAATTSDERDFVVSGGRGDGGGGGQLPADRVAEEDDEDDWEGVESTELDEMFSAATSFVAATAADRSKVSNDVQLELYGLYKIATEGPCTAPQPSALKMTARAKWNAWHKLGAMPPEEAMENYILIVDKLYPSWTGATRDTNQKESRRATNSEVKGSMGPVFSSFIHEENSDNESKLEDIHVSAREGKTEDLKRYLENGVSVNLSDSEGRTALHWAVDRGHLHVVEILVNNEADLNATDNEGQTPLHYAVLCEREVIAELLVKYGASCNAKDGDGNSPSDLGGSAWNFMTSGN